MACILSHFLSLVNEATDGRISLSTSAAFSPSLHIEEPGGSERYLLWDEEVRTEEDGHTLRDYRLPERYPRRISFGASPALKGQSRCKPGS
jgi:hypothetical protein